MASLEEANNSSVNRGRVSACSYRSYLSYDELAPDSLFTERLSLESLTAAAPTDNIALVTPHGTIYRLATGRPEIPSLMAGKCRTEARQRERSGSVFDEGPDVTSLAAASAKPACRLCTSLPWPLREMPPRQDRACMYQPMAGFNRLQLS